MDDSRRLQDLDSLLAVEKDTRLESYVRLAAAATGTPMSVLSLVLPDHDVYIQHYGLGESWSGVRDVYSPGSLCRIAVQRDAPLVIDNIPAAPDGEDVPVADEIGVRSYLGVPFYGPSGLPLGTLCVLCATPHQWSETDIENVRDLARLVGNEVSLAVEARARSVPDPEDEAILVENITDAVIVTDLDRRITRWNRAAERMFGYPAGEALGCEARMLLPPEEADRTWEEMRSGLDTEGHWTGEVPFVRKDGSRGTCETVLVNVTGPDGSPTHRLGISRDVSDRERVHGAMIQAQKLESLGQLSGGLAHDFNNLLSAILGAVSLLRISETSLSGDDNENLDTIESAARRGADITGRLLAFARGELSRLTRVDLRDVVNDALRLSRSSIPKSIDVGVDLPDQPVFVEGDAAQLQQALINILLNACYVMPDGGTLRLAVQSDETTGAISVTDTGPGIDAETRDRLFEPFFTTKPHGLGTGLGLPSAYGIVTGHHGIIEVDSELGRGATFHIRIPVLEGEPADAAPAQEAAPAGGAVLVVDDDDIVRRAVHAMLANLGFEAVEARDGQAALDLVREDPGRWSVVLLDLVMPGAPGAEIFRSLTDIREDLPVVIASGYAPDRFLEDGERRRISAVLHKPFTMDRLQSTLESVGITAGQPSRNGQA